MEIVSPTAIGTEEARVVRSSLYAIHSSVKISEARFNSMLGCGHWSRSS